MSPRVPNPKSPCSHDRVLPLLRAALIAAGLVGGSAFAQVQKAGDLFVDVDATQLPEGSLPNIKNNGTLGGVFEAKGDETMIPVIATVGGTKAIQFDGNDFLQLVSAIGGDLILPPEGLVGEDPTRTIEVWCLNPEVAGEETLVSWGKRGGPDGSNVSFGYGSDFRWGAVGHWGGDGPDLGWNNNGGNPPANKWHHLVYTYDGTTFTSLAYADGVLANGEILAAGTINTHPDTSICIATQLEADGIIPTAGLRLTGAIAKVRIHDGVLTGAQVAANYELEKAQFIDPDPAPPLAPDRITKGPIHRYNFNETAAADATGLEFKDSVGTAHGVVQGTGAAFTGSRLSLAGGPSAEAAYGDLPNGLVSQQSTNNGGSGGFTFETWFKPTGARTWSRVFDFGSSTSEDGTGEVIGPGGGGTGLDYIEYSAQIDNDVNSRRLEFRNEDPGGGGIVTVDVPTRGFNVDTHIAVTWDETTGRITVFENGTQLGGMTTDDAMSELNDVNVWLGRSNWVGDQNTQGEYDEARIYDYVLTPAQVLGNAQAGPDLLNDRDTAVTITSQPTDVSAPETLSATFRVSASGSTPIAFQWFRDGAPIAGATSSSYTLPSATSADNGAVFTVEVSNVVNGAPVKVTSGGARLAVTSDTVVLKHRYSFNETSGDAVVDSVGGKNGVVIGNAIFDGTSVVLDGSEGTYVDLPNGLLTGLGSNGTIEMWITYAGGANWARVFDFGTSNGGEDVNDGGLDFLFLTSKTAQGFPRFEANFPDVGTVAGLVHPGAMPVNVQEHLVITWSATGNTSRMYTNGTLVASATAPLPLSAMNNADNNNWLGRSQFADAYWAGKYNEFRLYSGAMGPAQVAANAAAGPGNLPAPAPTLSVTRDTTGVRITYTGTLESAPAVAGPWTAVAGASSPWTETTSGNAQKYYRARQ
ncbi:MAG: LamG-like jellyroll fold domain-containing protein [Limisphaerales bacterium]